MNEIEFKRQNGGVPKSLPGEDHYSGLCMYLNPQSLFYLVELEASENSDELDLLNSHLQSNPGEHQFTLNGIEFTSSDGTEFTDAEKTTVLILENGQLFIKKYYPFAERKINTISTIEKAESLGITANHPAWEIKALHYHLSEVFRMNPSIVLWVGLYDTSAPDFSEIKAMQNYAEGKIRQIGVYNPDVSLSSEDLTLLQGIATTLEEQDMPLSIIYCPKVDDCRALPVVAGGNKRNVSVVIGQAGTGRAAKLFEDIDREDKALGLIGNVLGCLSASNVHESIGWVQKFPTGIDTPAFTDGTLLKELDRAEVEELNKNRYIFLRTYGGLTGSYYNDGHTMDDAESDYAYIENVRTMDKAIRGIRTYLLPHLSAPLYVDAVTGQLRPSTVATLKVIAGRALEQMEKRGELSGYIVDVDPAQNVLESSTVEFVIKQVGVGVMRKISVEIGFTTSI